MAIPYWTLTTVAGSNAITNVQTVSLTKGRRVLTDFYSAGTASIEGRRPDLLPTLNIGDLIDVVLTNPNTLPAQSRTFTMRVADLEINYGTISALDTWTLSLEDAFAYVGRANITQTWASGTTTKVAFEDICSAASVTASSVIASSPKTVSATTVTAAPALNVMQTVINTEQGLLYARGNEIVFYTRGWQTYTTFYAFGDAGGATTAYQQVQFLSMADNYATYVVVTIDGSNPVVTGSGIYSYAQDTYALNATEAGYVGQYLDGALSVQTSTPNVLSVMLNTETSTRTLNAMGDNTGITLTLRTQTYSANVIGYTITSDPELTRVSFNLASSDFYDFLILDNTVYGKLDINRLGF